MSQHDMDVANGPGATVRTDINGALQALASNCAGPVAPATTFPCQWWADTTAGRMKRRNIANTGWVDMGALDTQSFLLISGGTLTGPINYAPTQTIASATLTDIGAATSNVVAISGTTAITGLGSVAAGARRTVRFLGSLQLTYNVTSLILPGNANITTAANDTADFLSLGGGNWICLSYTYSSSASARDALGVRNVGDGYICGLEMKYVGAKAVTISAGSAYIPGILRVLDVASPIALTGMSVPTANTFYHLYLYSNAGVPAIEVSTTAPVLYSGNASTKTGDTARRYIGTILTDASSNITKFVQVGNRISYTANLSVAPFLVLSGAVATVQSISCAAVIPTTATHGNLTLLNAASDTVAYFGNPDVVGTLTASNFEANVYVSREYNIDLSLSSTQAFVWSHFGSANANMFAYVYGYIFRR